MTPSRSAPLVAALALAVLGSSQSPAAGYLAPDPVVREGDRAKPGGLIGDLTVTWDYVRETDRWEMGSQGTAVYEIVGGDPNALDDASVFGSMVSVAGSGLIVDAYEPDEECRATTLTYAMPPDPHDAYFSVGLPERAMFRGLEGWSLDAPYPFADVTYTNQCWDSHTAHEPAATEISTAFDCLAFAAAPLSNQATDDPRRHLLGRTTLTLESLGCHASIGFTRFSLSLEYDLRRPPADHPSSQYPQLRVPGGDHRDRDVLVVQSDTRVRGVRVAVGHIRKRNSGWFKWATTDRRGRARFEFRDRNRRKARWFIAYVEGTDEVLAGWSMPRRVR
jgi:hypothetical protein